MARSRLPAGQEHGPRRPARLPFIRIAQPAGGLNRPDASSTLTVAFFAFPIVPSVGFRSREVWSIAHRGWTRGFRLPGRSRLDAGRSALRQKRAYRQVEAGGDQVRESEVRPELVRPPNSNRPASMLNGDRLEPYPEIGAAREALKLQEPGVLVRNGPEQGFDPWLGSITPL